MNALSTQQVLIIGCGSAGCAVAAILKEAAVPAYILAADDSEELLGKAVADKKILFGEGEKPDLGIDFSQYPVVLFALQPSEGSALTHAQYIASAALAANAYTYGFLIKPSGGWGEDDKSIYRSFDGAALIDEGWVLEVRKGKDPEYAMRIALNFTAHVLGILAEALSENKLTPGALKTITMGKLSCFAATATSEPNTIFDLTMSKIDKNQVRSMILFMPEDTDQVRERRAFLMISRSVPQSTEIEAIRVKRVEPFRILAMLAT